MILKQIKLFQFGGVKNLNLSFDDQLNVVLGVNESGKSTVFNAILKVLFANTQLKKLEFKNEISNFIPIDGDFAKVDLEFIQNGNLYKIKKSWGSTIQAELTLPDGIILNDENSIQQKISEIIPISEATFKSILMTYQSGLSKTIQDLIDKNNNALNDINDLLRSAVFSAGGISVDEYKNQLNDLCTKYLGRWNIEANIPEGRRGLENKWKQGNGSVLNSYYEMEETKRKLESAKLVEDKYDLINKEIDELSDSIQQSENYINNNKAVVEDSRKRKLLNLELMSINKDIVQFQEIIKTWPLLESDSRKLPQIIQVLKNKKINLEKDKAGAEEYEKNKSIFNKFKKVEALKEKHDIALQVYNSTVKLDSIRLDEIREIKNRADKLLTSINAGKLAVRINPKSNLNIKYKIGVNDFIEELIKPPSDFDIEGGGRIKIDHPDWSMEIKSGEGNIDELESKYYEENSKLQKIFNEYGIDTFDDAIKINSTFNKALSQYDQAKEIYEIELDNESYDELVLRVDNLNKNTETTPTKSLIEIVEELSGLNNKIQNKETELEEVNTRISTYVSNYGKLNEVILSLGKIANKQDELNQGISELLPLPPEFSNEDELIEKFENVKIELEDLKEERNRISLEKATLEGEMPDESVEELNLQLNEANRIFKNNLTKGNSILKLKQITDNLIKDSDEGIFDGLQDDLSCYISKITENKYSDLEMEQSIPTALIGNDGKILSTNLLSAGTQDVLGLSIRLALSRYFLKQDDGCIVMDDPLVDLDQDRQTNVANLIKEFAKDKQVIIFTCHPTHASLLGGKLIEMPIK